MRVIIFSIIFIAFILGVASIVAFIVRDKSFDSCGDIPKRVNSKKESRRLKIGIIGDSWVTDKKFDQIIFEELLDLGIQSDIVSSGQPGAVSREIYRNLIADNSNPYSSQHILMDEDIDSIIVVAGINDTVEHIGRDFYAHHTKCIINAILMRGMHPVVLEIPEYGIEITPPKSLLNYCKRLVYRYLFDKGEHCVTKTYRDALMGELPPEIMEKISIIPYSSLTKNYDDHLDLFENPNHINSKGYNKLGKIIARRIAKYYKGKSGNRLPLESAS